MFANEDSILQYFYERSENITMKELEFKFDNSTYEEILETVTALEKKNYVIWIGTLLWIITDIGTAHYERLIIRPHFYERRNFILTISGILLSTILSLIAIRCNR